MTLSALTRPENLLVLGATLLVGGLLLVPRLRHARLWRATVTPLASIIGSGFLVSGPLLANIAGHAAALIMAALCLGAYVIGAAIRFNIAHLEPLLARHAAPERIVRLEQASELALAGAYLISICFYIQLMAAFLLRGAGVEGVWIANMLATVVLAFLGITGLVRGFRRLELLEETSVGLKLAVIAGLLVGLIGYDVDLVLTGRWPDLELPDGIDFEHVRVALGSLLIVQGFETSRYIGHAYDAPTRVRSMRLAQWIATAIYVAFIVLATDLLDPTAPISETAIIDYAAVVAGVLPVLLLIGAVMAQFSAATADFLGTAGIITAHLRRVPERWLYPIIALAGIVLTWTTSVFEILAIASRAFAAYYLLQCVIAVLVARAQEGGAGHDARNAAFLAGAGLSAAVLVLGVPAH